MQREGCVRWRTDCAPKPDDHYQSGVRPALSTAQPAAVQPGRFTDIVPTKECEMNRERLEGNWMQCRGKLKALWGGMTHDSRAANEGALDQHLGRILERYGIAKEDAAGQLAEFVRRNRDWDPSSY
jgi:uncharacterized protein YjbJ (UPF0337 family)